VEVRDWFRGGEGRGGGGGRSDGGRRAPLEGLWRSFDFCVSAMWWCGFVCCVLFNRCCETFIVGI